MFALQILEWRWVNAFSPFVGLLACGYVLFSYKTCTSRKAISTAISLSIMMWLMLLWADWGSAVFVPSYQTMWSRVLLLAISALIMHELRRHTRTNVILQARNTDLMTDNAHLRQHIAFLHTKLKQQRDASELQTPPTNLLKGDL